MNIIKLTLDVDKYPDIMQHDVNLYIDATKISVMYRTSSTFIVCGGAANYVLETPEEILQIINSEHKQKINE